MARSDIKNRVGESTLNKDGEKMTIVEYRGGNDITVEFDNGCRIKAIYQQFKNRTLKNNIDRLNEITTNKCGSKIKIIEYNSYNNIIVEFDNGFITKTTYGAFKIGNIKSPYCKSVYGIGYLGEGKYEAVENDKMVKSYELWRNIFIRCYDKKQKQKIPTYEGCSICEEWHNYQNFAQWFDKNYYKIDNQQMHLDKDILIKGNKIYAPETCVVVPNRINNLFTKRQNYRGEHAIGVYYDKRNNKFKSCCDTYENDKRKQVYLGSFDNEDKAFNEYKQFKENYIKHVADEYKNKIPQKLYDAMYRYKVEITD